MVQTSLFSAFSCVGIIATSFPRLTLHKNISLVAAFYGQGYEMTHRLDASSERRHPGQMSGQPTPDASHLFQQKFNRYLLENKCRQTKKRIHLGFFCASKTKIKIMCYTSRVPKANRIFYHKSWQDILGL